MSDSFTQRERDRLSAREAACSDAVMELVEKTGCKSQREFARIVQVSEVKLTRVKKGGTYFSPEERRRVQDLGDHGRKAIKLIDAANTAASDFLPQGPKVFVASALDSIGHERLHQEAKELRAIVDVIDELAGGSENVYWAARKFLEQEDDPGWDSPVDSVIDNVTALQEVDLLVFIYHCGGELSRSTLLELGIAIGLKKHCVILLPDGAKPPYMFKGLESGIATVGLGQCIILHNSNALAAADELRQSPGIIRSCIRGGLSALPSVNA